MLSYRTFDIDESRPWVVFIHGAGGSSAVWFKQLRAFRERFNLLLVDLRGHGRSHDYHGGHRPYTLDGVSGDVLEVMDHLGIGRAHFVGVSLGSVLIRTLVEMTPDRIRSVVYAGAVAGFNLWARFLISAGHFLKHIIPFRTLYATFAWIIMPGRHAGEARQVFRREARQVAPAEFKRWMRLTREVNSRISTWAEQAVRCPTLYVMGALDYIFLPPVRKIVAAQRSARLRVIEEAGHVCNIERPDAFNEAAIGFLEGVESDRIGPVTAFA
jgi:pimeloyl-ACP methyl ester carboxylesterase